MSIERLGLGAPSCRPSRGPGGRIAQGGQGVARPPSSRSTKRHQALDRLLASDGADRERDLAVVLQEDRILEQRQQVLERVGPRAERARLLVRQAVHVCRGDELADLILERDSVSAGCKRADRRSCRSAGEPASFVGSR